MPTSSSRSWSRWWPDVSRARFSSLTLLDAGAHLEEHISDRFRLALRVDVAGLLIEAIPVGDQRAVLLGRLRKHTTLALRQLLVAVEIALDETKLLVMPFVAGLSPIQTVIAPVPAMRRLSTW